MIAAPHTMVIGGGIAGAAVALALRQLAVPVTVVDRHRPGRATAASAGMLAPLYEAPEPDPLVRLGLRGLELWPSFARRLEHLAAAPASLRSGGLLVANFDAEEEERAMDAAGRLAAAGLEAENLDPDAARELEPTVGEARSWLWLPAESQVDAQQVAGLLTEALAAAGARLVAGEVSSLQASERAVRGARLACGEVLSAERVVLAGGAWSGRLEGLPRALPVRPVRGQMLRYRPAPSELRRLVADHAGRYVVPRKDGSALAGSTMEEAGFDARTTEEGLDLVHAGARRLVPALRDTPQTDAWAGLRPITPDGWPILGPEPTLEGLFYATGYGRSGFLIAPAAGEAVAALVRGEAPKVDLGPFAVTRMS